MDINNNNNISFKASGVLTVKKALKNGQETVVDVFKLNHAQDDEFIRTCYNTLNENIDKMKAPQKKLYKFFRDFLKDSKTDSQDFYIGIKNGETIIGGYNSYPFCEKVILNNCITPTGKDTLCKDSFLYSLLQETKELYGKDIVGVEMPKFFKIEETNIEQTMFGKMKSRIKKQNPNTKFEKNKETNIDLAKYLDIKELF